ncbi:hypothetical protein N7540_005989 [Penicillium herquei]|nr:hypothetical protein N7540_005989 [Penicillium herquei]
MSLHAKLYINRLTQSALPESDDIQPTFISTLTETRSQSTRVTTATGADTHESIHLPSTETPRQSLANQSQSIPATYDSASPSINISPPKVSTASAPIRRNADELARAYDFLNKLKEEGKNWDQIRPLYRAEFNVERSATALSWFYHTYRHPPEKRRQSGLVVLRIHPSRLREIA